MLQNTARRVFSARFRSKIESFNALLIVYEVEKGTWRGFVYPYGETIEANTKKKTLKTLRSLVEAYYKTAKQYDFPEHLVNGGLTNPMDKTVFNWAVRNKDFMDKAHSKSGVVDSKYYYAETFKPQA